MEEIPLWSQCFMGTPRGIPTAGFFFPSIHSNYRLHMRHRSSNSKAGPRMSWLVRTEVLAYLEFHRSGGAVHGSIVQILRRKMKWIEITHYSWWSNFLIFINCTILYCCTTKTSDYWLLLHIYIIVMTWRNMIIIDGDWWWLMIFNDHLLYLTSMDDC